MIIMAVDFGKSRTGLAICDKSEILAYPLEVIEEKDSEALAEKIKNKIIENKAEIIVIGLPKNMDGTIGESAERVQNFAKILQQKTALPIDFIDERRTTITAHEYLNKTNVRGKKRKSIIDAVSATIMLESYLGGRRLKLRDS